MVMFALKEVQDMGALIDANCLPPDIGAAIMASLSLFPLS